MNWIKWMRNWLIGDPIRLEELSAEKSQQEYDDEQERLDEVWMRIKRAGNGYVDARELKNSKVKR